MLKLTQFEKTGSTCPVLLYEEFVVVVGEVEHGTREQFVPDRVAPVEHQIFTAINRDGSVLQSEVQISTGGKKKAIVEPKDSRKNVNKLNS